MRKKGRAPGVGGGSLSGRSVPSQIPVASYVSVWPQPPYMTVTPRRWSKAIAASKRALGLCAGKCSVHVAPSQVQVSSNSFAGPMPPGPEPPNNTMTWRTESYAATDALRGEGPCAFNCDHLSPLHSHVSPSDTELLPSSVGVNALPPNMITPRVSGS